jgi:hypothetical protein
MTRAAQLLFELPVRACRWPIGDPQHDSFRWCGAPAQPGGPYCAVHAERSRNKHDQPPGIVEAIERTGFGGRVGTPSNGVKAERYQGSGKDEHLHARATLGPADAE